MFGGPYVATARKKAGDSTADRPIFIFKINNGKPDYFLRSEVQVVGVVDDHVGKLAKKEGT